MPKSKEFVATDSGSATESEAEAEAKDSGSDAKDSGSDYEPKSKKKESKNGKKKARKESASEDSDSGADYEPKPKRSKKKEKKEEKSPKKSEMGQRPDEKFLGDFSVQLSKMRWLCVSQFKGKAYVNIREFYEADEELKPGKKGISLNREQWDKLKDHMGDIDKALKNM